MVEGITRRRNARKDTLTKTVIPRIENLLAEETTTVKNIN